MNKMKRLILSAAAFLLLFALSGCLKPYEAPWDQFCFNTLRNAEIILSAEDRNYIIDVLNNGGWTGSLAEHNPDFVFCTQSQEVGYHSSSGTFIDGKRGKSLTVTGEQREKINAMLNATAEAGNEKEKTVTLTVAETRPGNPAFEYRDGNPYCFYAFDSEGLAFRVIYGSFDSVIEKDVVTVSYSGEVREINETNPPGEWSVKFEINATGVTRKSRSGSSAQHIRVTSGSETVVPYSCLLWSMTDNGDGTFTETVVDKYDVTDLVNGNVPFSGTEIPVLHLSGSVGYSVQVNGTVEKVYLLSSDGKKYSKAKSSFEALSELGDGTYYVAFEVLLNGSCDPDASQTSSRYEDVFCLIVEGGKTARSAAK